MRERKRSKDQVQTAKDGIAERAKLVRVLLREIATLSEESDVPVEGLFRDLSEEERRRLTLPTVRDQEVVEEYWNSSTAECEERQEYYRRRGEKDPYEDEDNDEGEIEGKSKGDE